MSRSYKRNPVVSDYGRHRTSFYKRQANKKVRRSSKENIGNGSSYKRHYPSYDICDYKFLYTLDDFLEREARWMGRSLTPEEIEEASIQWKKTYQLK